MESLQGGEGYLNHKLADMLKLFNAKNQKLGRNIVIYDSVLNLYAHQKFNISIVKFTETIKEPMIYTETEKDVYLSSVTHCSVYVPCENMSVVLRVEDENNDGYLILVKRLYQDGTEDKTDLYQDLLTNKGLEGINLDECINPGYDSTELRKKLLLDVYKMFQNKGTKDSVENFFKFLCYDNDDNFSIEDILENKEKTGFYNALYKYWRVLGNGYDENNLPDFEIPSLELDKFLVHLKNAIDIANDYFTAEEQIIKFLDIRYNCNVPVFHNDKIRNGGHSFYDCCDFRRFLKLSMYTSDADFEEKRIVDNVLVSDLIPVHEVKFKDLSTSHTNNMRFVEKEYKTDSETIEAEHLQLFESELGAILHFSVSYPSTEQNRNLYYSLNITNGTETLNVDKHLLPKGNTELYHILLINYATYRVTFKIYDEFGNIEEYFYDFVLKSDNLRIDFEVWSSKHISSLYPNGAFNRDSKATQPNETYTPTQIVYPTATLNSVELPNSSVPQSLSQYYNVTPPSTSRWFQDYSYPVLDVFNKNFRLKDVTTIPIVLTENYVDVVAVPYQTNDELYFRVYDSDLGDYKFVTMTEFATLEHPLDKFMVQAMDVSEQSSGNYLIDKNGNYVIDADGKYVLTLDPIVYTDKPYWIFYSIMCGVEVPVEKLYIKRNNVYLKVSENISIRKREQIFCDIPVQEHSDAKYSYCSDTPYTETINGTSYPSIKCIFSHITRDRDYTDSYGLKLNDITLVAFNLKQIKLPVEVTSTISETFEGDLLSTQNHPTNIYRLKSKDILDFDATFKLRNVSYTHKLQSYQSYTES